MYISLKKSKYRFAVNVGTLSSNFIAYRRSLVQYSYYIQHIITDKTSWPYSMSRITLYIFLDYIRCCSGVFSVSWRLCPAVCMVPDFLDADQISCLLPASLCITRRPYILGDPEVTANLYCNFPYPYWEGCVICSIYICGNFWVTQYTHSRDWVG